MIKTQFSKIIKFFQTGNALEYHDSLFLYILDTTQALLILVLCLKCFWGEATLTVVYTINRIPLFVLGNQSLYDCLHETSPGYTCL